jgi:hypothetical protein
MTSIICSFLLFVASITSENAFVHLHLILMLLGVFVVVIGVTWGGACIRDVVGVLKKLTIKGAC